MCSKSMKKLLSQNDIITEQKLLELINLLLLKYNCHGSINSIAIEDNNFLALYEYKRRLIIINYKKILDYYLSIFKKDYQEYIEYINFEIVRIILHEIVHVRQHMSYEEILSLARCYEEILKKENKYNNIKYKTNTNERQANILSLMHLLNLEFIPVYIQKIYYINLKNNFRWL